MTLRSSKFRTLTICVLSCIILVFLLSQGCDSKPPGDSVGLSEKASFVFKAFGATAPSTIEPNRRIDINPARFLGADGYCTVQFDSNLTLKSFHFRTPIENWPKLLAAITGQYGTYSQLTDQKSPIKTSMYKWEGMIGYYILSDADFHVSFSGYRTQ